jgi:hypothetical protein
MTPHQQVRALVREHAERFVVSPLTRRSRRAILYWVLWDGDTLIMTGPAGVILRHRRMLLAMAVLEALGVFDKYHGLAERRELFLKNTGLKTDLTVEAYLRDLIIAHWEMQVLRAMERTGQ